MKKILFILGIFCVLSVDFVSAQTRLGDQKGLGSNNFVTADSETFTFKTTDVQFRWLKDSIERYSIPEADTLWYSVENIQMSYDDSDMIRSMMSDFDRGGISAIKVNHNGVTRWVTMFGGTRILGCNINGRYWVVFAPTEQPVFVLSCKIAHKEQFTKEINDFIDIYNKVGTYANKKE